METWESRIIGAIKQYVREHSDGSIKKASSMLGVPYETFKTWHDGKKSPTIKSISPYMAKLGFELPPSSSAPTIRRLGSRSPSEAVTGESLPTVPVYGSTGAGEPTELFSGEPETLIQVLPQYNLPDVAAFCVDGDSMEPTIMKGSYVGVVPFSGNISEGGIYLVNMPPFGRVIKRIRMGASGSIELHSDNKVYQPIPLPFEGYEEIVKGKVVWIWQLC